MITWTILLSDFFFGFWIIKNNIKNTSQYNFHVLLKETPTVLYLWVLETRFSLLTPLDLQHVLFMSLWNFFSRETFNPENWFPQWSGWHLLALLSAFLHQHQEASVTGASHLSPSRGQSLSPQRYDVPIKLFTTSKTLFFVNKFFSSLDYLCKHRNLIYIYTYKKSAESHRSGGIGAHWRRMQKKNGCCLNICMFIKFRCLINKTCAIWTSSSKKKLWEIQKKLKKLADEIEMRNSLTLQHFWHSFGAGSLSISLRFPQDFVPSKHFTASEMLTKHRINTSTRIS